MTIPHGRVPQNSRTADTVTRLYKNAAGEILAIHKINVVVTQMSVPRKASDLSDNFENRYHRSAVIDPVLTLFNRAVGQDRVIASIWHLGNYTDYTESNGTIQQLTYGTDNAFTVDLNLLPQIGDTI